MEYIGIQELARQTHRVDKSQPACKNQGWRVDIWLEPKDEEKSGVDHGGPPAAT